MKKILMSIFTVAIIISAVNVNAQFWKKKSKKTVKTEKKAPKDSRKDQYKKLLKDAVSVEGMFKVHKVKEKIYFEIPRNIIDKDFLISSRITSVSSTFNATSGRMPIRPILIRLSADNNKVYIHKANYTKKCADNSEMCDALAKNNIDPIWRVYDIEAFGKDSASCVIDISDLFVSDIKELSPFVQLGGIMAALNPKKVGGSFRRDASKITSFKAFSKNINVKSRLTYTVKGEPYTVNMSRNIIMLRDKPMRVRFADKRIGYFKHGYILFDENLDGSDIKMFIHKWDIKPRSQDLNKYMEGQLVEPEKPIVWYVDPNIPQKWRNYIKMGIQDWQEAFEEIGFKNAIIAKDYPTKEEDPNFDPDDISYNCYRFVATRIQNSMGPSYVDPRSGEIICADVLFYSDVTKLLHDWRFTQTAAADPRVRKKIFDDEIIGESLRYVAAHEIGHTLGLMHNFAGSYSIPVDSLRSPKYTQKYGTTSSIMDYARFNYVAQPGDFEKGVKLTPPNLGVYDKYAIKWGYKVIPTETPEEEEETLKKWISEKIGDPMYEYGPQTMERFADPKDQPEDLGNDVVKATEYGIKNLKYILKNLDKWILEEGDDYKNYVEKYKTIQNQFRLYTIHLMRSISGAEINEVFYGDGKKIFEFLPKDKQRKALFCLLNAMYEYPLWIYPKHVEKAVGPALFPIQMQSRIMGWFGGTSIMLRLNAYEQVDPKNAYTYEEFSNDIYNFVFKKTLANKSLTINDKNIQNIYVEELLGLQATDNLLALAHKKGAYQFNTDMLEYLGEDRYNYSFAPTYCVDDNISDIDEIFLTKRIITKTMGSPLNHKMLRRVHGLLDKMRKISRGRDKEHYETLFFKVDRFLN